MDAASFKYKVQEHEAHHSPPSSTQINIEWSSTSTPPMSSQTDALS